MTTGYKPTVAIIDYSLGNLFSVKHACEHAGMAAVVTDSRAEIEASDAVILPGVGAFGDAMESLKKRDLAGLLVDMAFSGKPFLGICLGVQLLMEESEEFGRNRGLGIFKGDVVRFENPREGERSLKVPQVGWNTIYPGSKAVRAGEPEWKETLLDGVTPGAFMYFVHSFYVRPQDPGAVLSLTEYGGVNFCSSVQNGNIFACQFHPERSGETGLLVYRNLFRLLVNKRIQLGE